MKRKQEKYGNLLKRTSSSRGLLWVIIPYLSMEVESLEQEFEATLMAKLELLTEPAILLFYN